MKILSKTIHTQTSTPVFYENELVVLICVFRSCTTLCSSLQGQRNKFGLQYVLAHGPLNNHMTHRYFNHLHCSFFLSFLLFYLTTPIPLSQPRHNGLGIPHSAFKALDHAFSIS